MATLTHLTNLVRKHQVFDGHEIWVEKFVAQWRHWYEKGLGWRKDESDLEIADPAYLKEQTLAIQVKSYLATAKSKFPKMVELLKYIQNGFEGFLSKKERIRRGFQNSD